MIKERLGRINWKKLNIDQEEIIFCEGGEALEKAAQGACGWHIPGSV